jgi:hypothetical protein
MSDMLNSFLRMANLYNPQQMGGEMPSELPIGPGMQSTGPNRMGAPITAPSSPYDTPWGNIDETVEVGVEPSPMSTLEAFRQNVLNPPKRKHMTYPKSTLNGLTEALKIAATPTDFEKNRVYINGDAHQQVRAFKDPTTGEVKYINKYKQPGFMEQVMKAMPASVSPAIDILNQPREDELADWELQNKGMKEAINAESAMALAKQREAQAGWYGARPDLERDKLLLNRMTAEEKIRVSQLRTLTDAQRIQMVQEGKMSELEYQAAAAMDRVEAQQAGANYRTGVQQEGANYRTGVQQEGANYRTGVQQEGANYRVGQQQAGADRRNNASIQARGTTAGATSQLPTQQKVALQQKAQQVVNERPEWGEYVTFNEQGFPVISMPDTSWGSGQSEADLQTYNEIYQAIYGQPRQGAAPITPPAAPPAPAATTPPATAKPTQKQDPYNVPIPPPKTPGVQPVVQYNKQANKHRISYDGGRTWQPYNPYGKK